VRHRQREIDVHRRAARERRRVAAVEIVARDLPHKRHV
jgi:hypothetical protein